MTQLRPSKHAKPAPRPKLSKSPWAGYAPGEFPREAACAICPDARCRRAKACLAAHDGLFCRRTHFSEAEHARITIEQQQAFLQRHPPVPSGKMFWELRKARIQAIVAERADDAADQLARWKAGDFDHLYGKWKSGGVVVTPPARIYVEQGRKKRG